ncbi:MAG TPA: hypothetical protein VFH78_02635 [Candidatus Thermoplasmatota archaeon]|nr:hypothetical protein [Candidatus Thermoplasmatota archaeon]
MRLGRLLVPLLLLVPLAGAQLPVASPCTPHAGAVIDTSCAVIYPGAKALTPIGQCTLNFVVTDGVELYVGTAGHCVRGVGDRVRVPGVVFGTVVQSAYGGGRDWAFVRVDPEDRHLVDPTLATWGGPRGAREAMPGEVVVHHGWGASLGQVDETRGRAGVVVAPVHRGFIYAGSVDSGDSGSPVMLATGEAAGIAVATIFIPLPEPARNPVPVTWATSFPDAMADLEAALGKPVSVVQGRPLVQP